MPSLWIFIAGISGFIALVFDAIGAHALHGWLSLSPNDLSAALQNWQTAARYQLIHALLLIMFVHLASKRRVVIARIGGGLIVVGTLLFCGGIYAKILTGYLSFGRLAPMGGFCFMLAWLLMGLMGLRRFR